MSPFDRHLRRVRRTVVAFLAALPLFQVAAVLLPRRETALSPGMITLLAAAAGLWLAFTAERDARARLDRIKRAFAVHGEQDRLMDDHLRVYVVVLLRLAGVAAFGVVAAVWGSGATATPLFLVAAGALMLLTWPTHAKVRLLVDRARALRPPDD